MLPSDTLRVRLLCSQHTYLHIYTPRTRLLTILRWIVSNLSIRSALQIESVVCLILRVLSLIPQVALFTQANDSVKTSRKTNVITYSVRQRPPVVSTQYVQSTELRFFFPILVAKPLGSSGCTFVLPLNHNSILAHSNNYRSLTDYVSNHKQMNPIYNYITRWANGSC